jgi:hypothetical protein
VRQFAFCQPLCESFNQVFNVTVVFKVYGFAPYFSAVMAYGGLAHSEKFGCLGLVKVAFVH